MTKMEKISRLQIWLNEKLRDIPGHLPLVVDGFGGPRTRAAIFVVFRNTQAPRITEIEKISLASRLQGTLQQINAVSAVEAPRGGWDKSGLLTCLYERHYGWRRWQIKIPFLSDPKPGGYTIDIDDNGINDSWEKVADAACKFGEEAFECASWGKFQIMGAWWKKLAYDSPLDFVYALSRSELAHYQALVRYIIVFNLVDAFRSLSIHPRTCIAFAKGYNGPAYAKNNYHVKLAQEMAR